MAKNDLDLGDRAVPSGDPPEELLPAEQDQAGPECRELRPSERRDLQNPAADARDLRVQRLGRAEAGACGPEGVRG